MGKLRNLPSRIRPLAPTVRTLRDAEGHAKGGPRNWYKLAEWERLRQRVFLRDNYTCQMPGCGKVVAPKSRDPRALAIADHKEPHLGDRALFFNERNVWTLCKSPCHDSLKQAIERRAQARGEGSKV